MVEGGGFEPPKLARQIYSLIPLATREPLQFKHQTAQLTLALLHRGGILWELILARNRFTQFFCDFQLCFYRPKIIPNRCVPQSCIWQLYIYKDVRFGKKYFLNFSLIASSDQISFSSLCIYFT